MLVIGGHEVASAELWDPNTGQWSPAGAMAGPREGATATLLSDGRVLVDGGHRDGDESIDTEVWDPATLTFSSAPLPGEGELTAPTVAALPALLPSAQGESRTLLPDGRILVAGGWAKVNPACDRFACEVRPTATAAIFDPTTGQHTPVGPMSTPRADHSATLLRDGRVLLVGSHTHGATDRSAEIFGPLRLVTDAALRGANDAPR